MDGDHRPGAPTRAPDGHALTVGDVITKYLRYAEAEGVHTPQAREDRVRYLGWLARDLGSLTVEEVRPYHLTDWIAAHPAWKSPSTRRNRATAVKACFEWAVGEGRIPTNPFKRVRYANAGRRPEMPDDVFDLLCRAANKPFERVLRFLRFTACRLSEACQATWGQFDLDKGLWVVEQHKTRKKTGKAKVVALLPEAVGLLRGMAAAAARPAAVVPTIGVVAPEAREAEVGCVFLNTSGTPWTRFTLAHQLSRLKDRCGIDSRATLHGIRHQAATEAVRNGAPLKYVSLMLGHASTAITEAYYVHADGHLDAIREAAKKSLPKAG